nr:replication initiator protein A [uncultured Blautia sp.]
MTEFLTANTNLPPYMVFPRFLLDTELNETTKLLYVILLDRARLSLKNEGWTDTSGHVFIYFTIEALAKVLHKSQMTIKTSLTLLEKNALILRKRQGVGQPNRIYVKFPLGTFHHTDKILSLTQTENYPSDRQNSISETDKKLSTNKKEREKNNLFKNERATNLSPYGKFQNVFLSDQELEEIKHSVSNWKEYIERLSGYMASTGKQYRNHAATIINWSRQDNPPSQQRIYESEEYETL